jgi:predicted MPP superfamily phosphohydrolase
MQMNRRQFLKALGHVSAAYAVGGVGLYQYGTRVEPEWLVVEQVQVPLKNLPPALEGFKIVQLSDIHIDSYTQLEIVQEAVTTANNLKPDLIVLTGDYVQREAGAIADLTPTLAGLNAKYGVFAILGNHELWTNSEVARAKLEQAGIPVLVNKGITLGIGQTMLSVAGLDDVWSGQPDLKQALDNLPSGTPTVLLAHEPDFADTVAHDGRVSLQLSGHSHGGQVRLPGLGALILPPYGQKYDQGLYHVEEMWVYTNRGLGLGPIPHRVNCPPEVTELTLVDKYEGSVFSKDSIRLQRLASPRQ